MISAESLRGTRLYLDANVFIYAVEDFPIYSDICRKLLGYVDAGSIQAVTSEISLAEVLVRPIQEENSEAVRVYEEMLKDRPQLLVEPISRALLHASARIRAKTGCRLPDAIHVATAAAWSSEILLTADKRMSAPYGCKLILLSELKLD